MDLEFDRASSRLKKEQESRLKKEKAKREADRRAAEIAKRKIEEIEEQAKVRRAQQAEEERIAQEQKEEEERRTGGVEWADTFVAAPLDGDKGGGDRITLPPSALHALDFKGAMEQKGPMHFELTTKEGARTHAGVLEFIADDGRMGLPAKVASCLAAVTTNDESPEGGYNTRVQAKYVRLEKGSFVTLRPRTREFARAMATVNSASVPVFDSQRGKWVLPGLEGVLHTALQPLCCLTLGDTVSVVHAVGAFELDVVQLEPMPQVSLIDTDIQVEIAISKEEEEEMQREEEAKAASQQRQAMREQLSQEAASRVVEEPPEGAEGVVMFAIRLPDGRRVTRRVLKEQQLQVLFDFLDAGDGITAGEYQLVASFPRRVFGHDAASQTVEEAGLAGPQEALFLEPASLPSPTPMR